MLIININSVSLISRTLVGAALALTCSVSLGCRRPLPGEVEDDEDEEMDEGIQFPDVGVDPCQHDRIPERFDCPAGMKCMPFGEDFQDDGCFALADTPVEIGALCEDGDLHDGLDPCVAGAACVGHDGGQVCAPFCTFVDGEYSCPANDQTCSISANAGNRWCRDNCDPLASECINRSCTYAGGEGFFCVGTGTKSYGEPCVKDHECQSGMGCAWQLEIEGCLGGCCTPYCTVDGEPCPDAASGQECWFIYDQAPPAYDHIGACAWPF